MSLRIHRRQNVQLSEFERRANVGRLANQRLHFARDEVSDRLDIRRWYALIILTLLREGFGLVDKTEVFYTATRLKTSSTNQLSRRSSRHTTHTYRQLSHCRPTIHRQHLQYGQLCQFVPSKGAWLNDSFIAVPITCTAIDNHSTTPFGVVLPNGIRTSSTTNQDSIWAVMTIVYVCGGPVVNVSILPSFYSGTPLPQLV
ncbi:hypothetical protein TNCV_229591 [Trichonephila clavipes]|nr:hypothetical protein TNCV_229591 [Trichonephila clavipes]